MLWVASSNGWLHNQISDKFTGMQKTAIALRYKKDAWMILLYDRTKKKYMVTIRIGSKSRARTKEELKFWKC